MVGSRNNDGSNGNRSFHRRRRTARQRLALGSQREIRPSQGTARRRGDSPQHSRERTRTAPGIRAAGAAPASLKEVVSPRRRSPRPACLPRARQAASLIRRPTCTACFAGNTPPASDPNRALPAPAGFGRVRKCADRGRTAENGNLTLVEAKQRCPNAELARPSVERNNTRKTAAADDGKRSFSKERRVPNGSKRAEKNRARRRSAVREQTLDRDLAPDRGRVFAPTAAGERQMSHCVANRQFNCSTLPPIAGPCSARSHGAVPVPVHAAGRRLQRRHVPMQRRGRRAGRASSRSATSGGRSGCSAPRSRNVCPRRRDQGCQALGEQLTGFSGRSRPGTENAHCGRSRIAASAGSHRARTRASSRRRLFRWCGSGTEPGRDDRQGRVLQRLLPGSVEGRVEIRALLACTSSESVGLPDIGPAVAAGVLVRAPLEAARLARRVHLDRCRLTQQTAQVDEVLLRCRRSFSAEARDFVMKAWDVTASALRPRP